MVDTCTIKRAGSPTVDPDTGDITPNFTTIYTGKCKVQQRSPATTPTVVGDAAVFEGQLELHLPVSVTGPQPDDLAEFPTSIDPDLTGRTFHLRGPAHKTYLTARRFPIVEVSG